MSAAARPGFFTFDGFCTLVSADQKADLIDGVIYMASPEGLWKKPRPKARRVLEVIVAV